MKWLSNLSRKLVYKDFRDPLQRAVSVQDVMTSVNQVIV